MGSLFLKLIQLWFVEGGGGGGKGGGEGEIIKKK